MPTVALKMMNKIVGMTTFLAKRLVIVQCFSSMEEGGYRNLEHYILIEVHRPRMLEYRSTTKLRTRHPYLMSIRFPGSFPAPPPRIRIVTG
jgi:hypothetical protein